MIRARQSWLFRAHGIIDRTALQTSVGETLLRWLVALSLINTPALHLGFLAPLGPHCGPVWRPLGSYPSGLLLLISPFQCAGINRHEAENAKFLRVRSSDPLGPEFCVGYREVHDEA